MPVDLTPHFILHRHASVRSHCSIISRELPVAGNEVWGFWRSEFHSACVFWRKKYDRCGFFYRQVKKPARNRPTLFGVTRYVPDGDESVEIQTRDGFTVENTGGRSHVSGGTFCPCHLVPADAVVSRTVKSGLKLKAGSQLFLSIAIQGKPLQGENVSVFPFEMRKPKE